MTIYKASKSKFLLASAGMAMFLSCKTLDTKLITKTNEFFNNVTYNELVDPFLEKTEATYLAHRDGATITYNGENGRIKVWDGTRKLDSFTKMTLNFLEWAGAKVVKFDGIPDGAIISSKDGRIDEFNHSNGIESLETIAQETKKITTGIRSYFTMFRAATFKRDISFDRNGDNIIAYAGDYTITVGDTNEDSIADYVKVMITNNGKSKLIAEINGTPEIFEEQMKNLFVNANLVLNNNK